MLSPPNIHRRLGERIGQRQTILLYFFLLAALGVAGWRFFVPISIFVRMVPSWIADTLSWIGGLALYVLTIKNIPRWIIGAITLLVFAAAAIVVALILRLPSSGDAETRRQRITSYILIVAGLPFIALGLLAHVDSRLSPYIAHTVPFPGWEALMFILGVSLTLHGLCWGQMTQWKRALRVIDYAWYTGGTVALIIGATNLYKAEQVSFFEATLTQYELDKPKIIQTLLELQSFCDGKKSVADEDYANSAHARPSRILCELAGMEKWIWEADSFVKLAGFSRVIDFRLLSPYLSHSTGRSDAQTEYSYGLRRFLDSRIESDGEKFCQIAAEEWQRSGWEAIEKKKKEVASGAIKLPSVTQLKIGKIGENELYYEISLPIEPPHRFGADACKIRNDLVQRFTIHAGRTFLFIPHWMAWLSHSWFMFLSVLISLRLLKVTAEFRR